MTRRATLFLALAVVIAGVLAAASKIRSQRAEIGDLQRAKRATKKFCEAKHSQLIFIIHYLNNNSPVDVVGHLQWEYTAGHIFNLCAPGYVPNESTSPDRCWMQTGKPECFVARAQEIHDEFSRRLKSWSD